MDILLTILHSAFFFFIVLTIVVFFHELGHYLAAKISGVKVEIFSIGFGKELFGFNDSSGTRWRFSLVPLGGYVKMFGDLGPASIADDSKIKEMTEQEKRVAFHTKPLASKSFVVAAGPIANFILAIIILTFYYNNYGRPVVEPVITHVQENSAAQEAGLQKGDRVLKLDSQDIDSFSDIKRIVQLNTSTPLPIKVERKDKTIDLVVTPKIELRKTRFGEEIKIPIIGIAANIERFEDLGPFESFIASVDETKHLSLSTLKAIKQLITGQRSPKEISGPIGIAKYSGQTAQLGLKVFLWFIAILSINLGLINLFPIPLLDGGHLVFYAVEAIIRRPVPERVAHISFKVGTIIVAALFAFAIVNDLAKFNFFN